jgi:hypothetical protein
MQIGEAWPTDHARIWREQTYERIDPMLPMGNGLACPHPGKADAGIPCGPA